jgi:hypothetical protein
VSINCLVLGESGTGKTCSLRNLPAETTAIIQTLKKPMPFRANELSKKARVADEVQNMLGMITSAVAAGNKIVIVDDAQFLMAHEFFRRADEKGFDKFSQLGANAVRLLRSSLDFADDVRVYFLWHTEIADGRTKAKTIGKLIDDKYTVEGAFSIVLRTLVTDEGYFFSTKNSGFDTVKTPYGMFDNQYIPNDLKAVDDAIVAYYGIGGVE